MTEHVHPSSKFLTVHSTPVRILDRKTAEQIQAVWNASSPEDEACELILWKNGYALIIGARAYVGPVTVH